VKTRFQSLPFKCNLQRYDEAALHEIQRELNKVGFFANGATQLPLGKAAHTL
jgi:hypothetical protein